MEFCKFVDCDKLRSVCASMSAHDFLQVWNETFHEFSYRGRELGRKLARKFYPHFVQKLVHVVKTRRGREPLLWEIRRMRVFPFRFAKMRIPSRESEKSTFSWNPWKMIKKRAATEGVLRLHLRDFRENRGI